MEDLSVDGRIIFKLILMVIVCECLHWFNLAEDWIQWRDIVNTVMELYLNRYDNSWKGTRLSAYQIGPSSMDFVR
jgi:hypothetical protein